MLRGIAALPRTVWLVGLVSLMGIELPESGQWALFAVLALISFFTFRKSLYQRLRGGAVGFRESLDGEQVTVGEYLAVGAQGRTEFRGTQWSVLNVGETPIAAGQKARVIHVDGVTLRVKGE